MDGTTVRDGGSWPRARWDGDVLFAPIAGLGAGTVLAVVAAFLSAAGGFELAGAVAAVVPVAAMVWLVEWLLDEGDDGRAPVRVIASDQAPARRAAPPATTER